MRDSDYRAVLANRAAVTMSNGLYDRRALDVSSDKPLVNSLNYLTYLASSLAKVRETLAADGGIERLIEILHECHNTCCNAEVTVFNSERKLMTAWKWTLAFQCLVLVGTRGSESTRQKVVHAGILPILATVLDNFLFLHDRPSDSSVLHLQLLATTASTARNVNLQENANNGLPTGTQAIVNPFRNFDDAVVATAANPVATPTHPHVQTQFHAQQPDQTIPQPIIQQNAPPVAQTWPDTNRWNDRAGLEEAPQPMLEHAVSRTSSQSTISGDEDEGYDHNAQPDIALAHSADEPSKYHYFDTDFADLEGLNTEELFNLVRLLRNHESMLPSSTLLSYNPQNNHLCNEIRRNAATLHILDRFQQETRLELPRDIGGTHSAEYDMDVNLGFVLNYSIRGGAGASAGADADVPEPMQQSVRSFTHLGVVIPHEDDVVWALQLLAYVSKFSSLKEQLQNTSLVVDMSIRDKHVKRMVTASNRQISLASWVHTPLRTPKPILMPFILDFYVRGWPMDVESRPALSDCSSSSSDEDIDTDGCLNHTCRRVHCTKCESLSGGSIVHALNQGHGSTYISHLHPHMGPGSEFMRQTRRQLAEAISNPHELEREMSLAHITEELQHAIANEKRGLKLAIRNKRRDQQRYLSRKWDYEEYDGFNIDEYNQDQDDALVIRKTVDLFPLVEKYTFLAGTDMYYWAGVVMRNSCRRSEARGGVRQCGNLDCGKWETFPREFSKCRRCKRTKYCSRECQLAAWTSHRNWCVQSSSSATATNTTITTSVTMNPSSTNENEERALAAEQDD